MLLTGDQMSISNGIRIERSGYFEVGIFQLSSLFLDPVGLDLLTDRLIGKFLFGIGKTGPGLILYKQFAIGPFGLQQQGSGMSNGGTWFPSFVK